MEMMSVPKIKIDWVPRRLRRGELITLRIALDIPEGYHIQAHKPAEELMIPTSIGFEGAKDITIGEPDYPEPQVMPVAWSEVKLLTYEGMIDITVSIQIAKDAKPGVREIGGKLKYQSCTANACLPPTEQKFYLKLEIV